METKSFFQIMEDGAEICINRWIPDGDIKGIIHISHGMAEHSMRYDRFATILAEKGYLVSAADHRGHGKTAQNAQQKNAGMLGFLAEKDGFNRVTRDIHEIILKLKEDYSGKKVILFAHSFGSFIGQNFIEKYGAEVEACVLCGTAGPRQMLMHSALFIGSIEQLFCGNKHVSNLLNKLAFGAYNKKIKNKRTNFDWLSVDEANVDLYLSDIWCGFVPTTGFFIDMFKGFIQIHKAKNMNTIPKNLPIYLICGKEDPVGDYSKTVTKLFKIYKKIGITDVELKVYENIRHEVLNDTSKDIAIEDITNWLTKRL